MAQDALMEERRRRVKRICISPELVLALIQLGDDGTIVNGRLIAFIRDPVPSSAKALRCGLDENGTIHLLIEDASFDEVLEGDTVPILTPILQSQELK